MKDSGSLTVSPSAPLLGAEDVTVTLGGKSILDSINLALRPGEIVTLIGPNGSGKTTLVRALLGLVRPTTGRVVRSAKRIGYVPQMFSRDWSIPLTARRFVLQFGGGNEGEATSILERMGAGEVAEKQMAALSGGELARVALARALIRKPDLLILDEPLSGVDLVGEAALYELIARMRDETGAGVFLVSHDLHIVMAAADRVICLNRHVCCEGDAAAVVRDPAFIGLFGPRIAEQLALYTHRHDHAHAPSGAILASAGAREGEGHHG